MPTFSRDEIHAAWKRRMELQDADDCRDVACWTEALLHVNDGLYDLMVRDPHLRGFGTTVVGAALSPDGLLHFNVGDSRAYHFSADQLIRLSEDDVPAGTTGPRPGRSNHGVTQCLGGTFGPGLLDPHVSTKPPLRRHETLLLCSDGLTDMVAETDIEQALRIAVEPETCVMRLLQLALDGGGEDNISIIVAVAG